MRNRWRWLVLLCIFLCFGLCINCLASEKKAYNLQFFFENVCASCHEEDKFYELFNRCITPKEKETITYEIRTYNVFREADKKVYEELLVENGKTTSDYPLPVLAVNGQWISGYDKIEKELHGILIEGKSAETETGQQWEEEPENDGEAEEFSIPELDGLQDFDPVVLLFSTYSCEDCSQVKAYLEELQKDTAFTVAELSVAEDEDIQLFKELLKIYGENQDDGKVPAIFAGDRVFLGKEEIREGLPEVLEQAEAPFKTLREHLDQVTGEEEISKVSLVTLFGSGLLAGLNPCAISMLLMLFSILLTTRASVLKNGLLYLLGKYVTYLGLGLGICLAASKVDQVLLEKFGTAINLILVVLCVVVAVMNVLDFFNIRKNEYGKVRMQLPAGLRRLNHKLLKKAGHMEGAFLGVLVLGLGIAISLGEFFCSGQIYMASILYLLRTSREQIWQLLGTLMVYVTAMSIPAMVILLVIYKTRGTSRVSDFMLKNMGKIKLLNAFLFLLYGIYFIFQIF